MKISIIQPRISYYVGGGENLPIIHSKLMADLGHRVDIYTTRMALKEQSHLYLDLKALNNKNINLIEVDVPQKFKYLYSQVPGEDRKRWDTESLLFNHLIYRQIEKSKPDLILSYYILDGLFKPLQFKSALYLVGYASDELEIRTSFLRFFDAYISISTNVEDRWAKHFDDKPKKYILNSGVNIDNEKTKVKTNYKENLVFVGRLVERKGVTTLLKAFKDVADKKPDVHLWIVGDGPKKSEYKKDAKKLGIHKNISFTGNVSNVKDYMRMSDLCIFPSYEKEGLMGVVLEAMSAGKAVITTTKNGNEDVIKDGENGILVEPKNQKQLANQILSLLNNPDKRNKTGRKARVYAENNFTWEMFAQRMDKIIKDITK